MSEPSPTRSEPRLPGPPETANHRLVLPADTNHYGTLYAGALLQYGLETAYATASRAVGPAANLMLRRVLSIECRQSVAVGALVEIRGAVLSVRRGYLAVGVIGMPLHNQELPWMDGLFGFAQVGSDGLPCELPADVQTVANCPLWLPLIERHAQLARIRGATAGWLNTRKPPSEETPPTAGEPSRLTP
jgi:acyl-CoA thioesterase YciA